tara:strand:+ start:3156 stop:3812 length:657 start_codon:yes stop_codon:yes gene_type:complete
MLTSRRALLEERDRIKQKASIVACGSLFCSGTAEANDYTVAGKTLDEYIADTVGDMVSGNTETNISVAYQDADNTLDFTIGTLNQDTTGVAAEAFKVHDVGGSFLFTLKIFTGTSAAVDNAERITHGITNGKQRIAMISVAIATDSGIDPSIGGANNPPAGSFLTGGGSVQDEIDIDRQFQTYYDDTYIYIVTDAEADDVAGNRYVCTIWYTDGDIYA